MSDALPPFYFRIRDNGAAVFKLDSDPHHRRMEMEEIATLNIRNGSVKPHGERPLRPEEQAAITAWMTTRQAQLQAREIDQAQLLIEEINLLTHWLQSKAEPAQIEALCDPLLLAMHDLRSTLIRKRSEALLKG